MIVSLNLYLLVTVDMLLIAGFAWLSIRATRLERRLRVVTPVYPDEQKQELESFRGYKF